MFGKVICFVMGHKRGKLLHTIPPEQTITGTGYKEYMCPRCNAIWTRKAKRAA